MASADRGAESTKENDIEDVLCQLNILESKDGFKKKNEAVTKLEALLVSWVRDCAAEKNVKVVEDDRLLVQLLPYGGHPLGVATRDGDVDTVCIVPQFVQRSDFFTKFVRRLERELDVAELRVIEGAYVPLLKLTFYGTKIDVCLAILNMDMLPADFDVMDESLNGLMDVASVRAFNGVKQMLALKSLVPDLKRFCVLLQVIKVWAKLNGIHSSQMGYPGGVTWAIMAARVCQLYPPESTATQLVKYFFDMYAAWEWPNPVMLCLPSDDDPFGFEPWNPRRDTADGRQPMAVITPAYPEKNSVFAVTQSALSVVVMCLVEASRSVAEITSSKNPQWNRLFEPVEFFLRYKHFLKVSANARTDQQLLDWSRLVSSRLRVFVASLERRSSIKFIHLLAESFASGTSVSWFIGIAFNSGQKIRLDIEKDVDEFIEHVRELGRKRNLYAAGMSVDVMHVREKDLSKHLATDQLHRLNVVEHK